KFRICDGLLSDFTISPCWLLKYVVALCEEGIRVAHNIIGRKVLLPLRTPSVRWEQSRLRAVVKMEWERASLRYALPALPDRRMLLRQSPMRFPPSLHIVHILHRRRSRARFSSRMRSVPFRPAARRCEGR